MKAAEKQKTKELGRLQALVSHYDKNIDDTLNERMVKVTQKLAAEAEERVATAEHEKDAKAKRVAELQDKNDKLRSQLEVAQGELFDLTQQLSKKDSADKEDDKEKERVMEDLEIWKQRAIWAEKQVQELKSREPEVDEGREELERQLEVKDGEISRILDKLNKEQEEVKEIKAKSHGQISALEDQLQAMARSADELKEKLESQSDYESIRKELDIIHSLEYLGEEEDGAKSDPKEKV